MDHLKNLNAARLPKKAASPPLVVKRESTTRSFFCVLFIPQPSSIGSKMKIKSLVTRLLKRMPLRLNALNGRQHATLDSGALPFTIVSALAVAISYADRSNLSTAIIPMTGKFSRTYLNFINVFFV